MKIRTARISDSKAIRKAGLMEGSVSAVEDRIRSVAGNDETELYILKDGNDVISLCKVSITAKDDRAHLEFLRNTHISFFLDSILRIMFFERGIYKVTVEASVNDREADEAFSENGLIQEALLHDHIRENGTYVDAGLFYILAPCYSGYNVCFVPFQRGVLQVKGGIDYVDSVSFLNYGGVVEDPFARLVADYMGLLDDDHRLKKRNAPEYDTDPSEFSHMPPELIRAYVELREYFLKKRDTFDINIRYNDATNFQISVWEEIKKIPYGATVSYEDIALKLSDNDITRARKLTRAVGAACSDNRVPVLIPCHRVIGKNGKLVGFSGGIEYKDFLLQNELFRGALLLN